MARLSEEEAGLLVERLAHAGVPEGAAPDGDSTATAARLHELCASGELAAAIGTQLAGYLKRPVRCANDPTVELTAQAAVYEARSGTSEFWLAVDPLLLGSFSDAMIGGEGDPLRVGIGSKASRVASRALDQVFAALAHALQCSPPGAARRATSPPRRVGSGGGTIAVGAQAYPWRVGLHAASPAVRRASPRSVAFAEVRAEVRDVVPATLEAALAAAGRACSGILRRDVLVGPPRIVERKTGAMPRAWLAVGAQLAGGTAMLWLDETTAVMLLECLLGRETELPAAESLLRAGLETIAIGMLQAMIAVADPAHAQHHRLIVMSEDAMLAATPHDSIEHDLRVGERLGSARWLIPSGLLARST
jgi:hypothetical protein